MSFKWASKDPDEILDYSVDWSRWLNNTNTLLSCDWFVDDADGVKTPIPSGQSVNGIQNISQSINTTVATIVLGIGLPNIDYKFYCRIIASNGNIAERVVRIKIKEQ